MKFNRTNFKEVQRRAKNLLAAYWEQRRENAELKRQYNELTDAYLKSLRDRVAFMEEIAQEKLAEIDQFIEREKSNMEYLSRESLEVRFQLNNYRQN